MTLTYFRKYNYQVTEDDTVRENEVFTIRPFIYR